MRIRTLFLILFMLGATLGAALLFDANREALRADFHFWGDAKLPVGVTLVLFLAAGMCITLVLGLAREFSIIFERRRHRKESKKQEDIEEKYSNGLIAVLEGREEEALKQFRSVLEQDSRHFNTLIKIGEVLRYQGRYSDAIEYHRKAHHLKEENTQPLYALVEDYEAKGDIDRARVVLGKIIGIKKESMSAWRKLRSLHVKERNWEKALEAHLQVEKLSKSRNSRDETDRRYGRGIRYEIASDHLEAGRVKESLAIVRKLLKEDSAFIPAHVALGEALLRSGQDNEAVQAWFQGFEITGSPIFLTLLEEHFLRNEQPLAAIEALKRGLGHGRKDTLPRFYLGKLYFRLEMLDDAFSVLSSLQGRASYAPNLHYLLGRIHERRKNYPAAAAEYRRVIKEMDLVQLEYRCRGCGETMLEWVPACGACHEWNTVEVNFREEISLEELGLAPAPIYSTRV